MKTTFWLLPIATAVSSLAHAADAPQSVVVVGNRAVPDPRSLSTSDTAEMLLDAPGASLYGAGGVSGLPVLRGLADDRIKVRVDGAEASAACGNHMNPPLSYLDPTQVTSTRVMAGITPVSAGGDNIGGVISVNSVQPMFASDDRLLTTGSLSLQARSVDRGVTKSASATLASENFSATYTGAMTSADSYKDGHGDKVLDTLYKSINQSLTLGARTTDQLLTLKIGQQRIPYQGFANQFMDMTDNHAVNANLAWDGTFDWGRLHGRLFWQNTRHEMGFFTDEKPGTMPMNTHGRDSSASLQAELPALDGTLTLGAEAHRQRLDDWWPPVADSMMMGPDTYQNIRNGRRARLGLYSEWDGRVAPQWTLNTGLRAESVRTDAGTVQSYGCGMMCMEDDAAAAAFNASDRSKSDFNVDAHLTARHELDAHTAYELGVAHKTRSPNLYERYAWGRGTMAMTMTGWFGDANGYVGNLALKPEAANTLSATAEWRGTGNAPAKLQFTPFYTQVRDFIDVDVVGSYQPSMMSGLSKALLKFANHDAHLYGFNLSWDAPLAADASLGSLRLRGKFDWTRGRRDDGGDLYHIMPPNLTLTLAHTLGAWASQAELQAVGRKSRVDARRDEPTTPGYALLNLGTRYQFANGASVQAGIRNVFNRQYQLPLGGVDIAAFQAGSGTLDSLRGQGRSFDLGVSLQF